MTGDDVLQAGDEVGRVGVWDFIPEHWIGTLVGELTSWNKKWTFRRPLTPSEITAAERKRFLEHFCDLVCDGNSPEWNGWRAAVGCDPMGDIQ